MYSSDILCAEIIHKPLNLTTDSQKQHLQFAGVLTDRLSNFILSYTNTQTSVRVLMHQKFAFTTAAMAAALEDTPVSYEDLADIEREFDDAETEISEYISAPYILPLISAHRSQTEETVALRLTNSPHHHSPATSRPHSTPLRATRAYHLSDPELLAACPGAGAARH
jgi:hypothetical protein